MKIRVKKFMSGERYPFAIDESGVPDFWVTHFVSQRLRMSHASTSIENYLKDLKHLKIWESLNDRDLLEEIYQGKIPNRADIEKLQEHCCFQSIEFKKKPVSKVVDMGKFHLSKSHDRQTVSKRHYNNRVAHIAEFLHFIGLERVKFNPRSAQLIEELDQMKKLFKAKLSKARLKNISLNKTGITDDEFEDFVSVAKPDSEFNPFKNPAIKIRNYLIVQTLYETGLRCSELLALRIGDIGTDIDEPTLSVVRRHDSKDDNRFREPTAKTLSRVVPISRELRDSLNSYIRNQRTKSKASKRHPFIFVSHKSKTGSFEDGQAIVQRTINALFDCIKAVNPERFAHISPHAFRHYFNDKLSESVDKYKDIVNREIQRLEESGRYEEAKLYANENAITTKRESEIRAELNGHSSLDSGRIYTKRTVKKQASNLRKAMLENMKHKAKGS